MNGCPGNQGAPANLRERRGEGSGPRDASRASPGACELDSKCLRVPPRVVRVRSKVRAGATQSPCEFDQKFMRILSKVHADSIKSPCKFYRKCLHFMSKHGATPRTSSPSSTPPSKTNTACAWETPVNHAAEHIWACRRIEVTPQPTAGRPAFKSLGKNPLGYPLTERKYELKDIKNSDSTKFDFCLAELRYTHIGMAEYPAGSLDFSPQQRVALVYELYDDSGGIPPHQAIQALPVYSSMNRLSNKVPASRQAVSIRINQ